MKKINQMISAMLLVLMCLSFVIPMSAESVAPVASADPFEGISEDEYSVISWNKDNLTYSNHLYPELIATLESYRDKACVKMVKQTHSYSNFLAAGSAYATDFNAAINPGEAEYEENDLAYCVVTYASDSDKAYSFWFWCPDFHSDGRRAEKIAEVSAGKKDWANSGIITVTEGFKKRIMSKSQVVITADTKDGDAEIYIGDIIFFENKEAAEKYLSFGKAPAGSADENGLTEQFKLLMLLVGKNIGKKEDVLTSPFDGINKNNYSIVKWTASNLKPGNQKTATVIEENGDTYVKMVNDTWKPSKFNSDGTIYAKTRMYSAAVNPGDTEYSVDNLAYMVVNYKTVNADAHGLYVYCPSYNTGDTVRSEKIADAPENSGGWINSNIIAVTDGLKNRIKNATQQVSFLSDSQSPNAEIYISSIIFFKNESDAEKYLAQYAEYYGTERVIPKPFDGIDEGNYSIVKWTTDNLKKANQKQATVIEENGDTYVKMVNDDWKPSKFNSDGSTYNKTRMYSAAINPGDTEYSVDNLAYMVVNYKTVNADTHGLYVYCPSYNTGDAVRAEKIASASAETDGWVNSDIIKVTDGLKNRIKGTGQVSFLSDSQSETAEIYISSIIFFRNESDAEKYIRQYNDYNSKHN